MLSDLANMTHELMWGFIDPIDDAPSLVKGLADEDELDPSWLMKGLATAEILDADGQVLEQGGIDWSEWDQRGITHYKHPYAAERVCGQGVSRRYGIFSGVPGNHITVALLKGLPVAQAVRAQHMELCKGPKKRGLGFSVEGKIDEMRRNRITKCRVRTMAIDAAPRGPMSFAQPLAAALSGQTGYAQFPPELMKAAMSLAYDPEIQRRLALTEGMAIEDLRALRLLKQSPGRTLVAALERVASMS